jgi:hypothetical protein
MSGLATTRPWSSDLEDRLWTRARGRSRFSLPKAKPSSPAAPGRPLNAEQVRRLRAEWLGLRVDLFDYAGTHRAQRGFAVRRACTLDDLATLICAAFGRDDTEHLYLYEIGGRRFSHPALACNDGSATTDVAVGGVGLRSGERFLHLYDMGDQWQHSCKVETIPRDILRSLRAHGGDRTTAPALQYAATGRSPRQYPRSDDD